MLLQVVAAAAGLLATMIAGAVLVLAGFRVGLWWLNPRPLRRAGALGLARAGGAWQAGMTCVKAPMGGAGGRR